MQLSVLQRQIMQLKQMLPSNYVCAQDKKNSLRLVIYSIDISTIILEQFSASPNLVIIYIY